ncbi:hypothetical protein [Streptomyces chartreusis]|uniref:hypothetical protein n=1 Tax=Streptomyces chartreusis TaxID=1969 RepID=UPI00198DD703|nr:hypothetical protein [Streptomyces chartreusis]GGX56457.1 hypothetical protein GCM10010321_87200 [Streptomyces chartreusis]
MPIRPENVLRYPANWPAISRAIKERAGWRCECLGECGRGTHSGRCPNVHEGEAYGTGSTVCLTTAHLDHTPENCDPANLRAMCQGCHLHLDAGHHAVTRSMTRARALAEAGQLTVDVGAAATPVMPPARRQSPPSVPAPEADQLLLDIPAPREGTRP